MQRNPNNDRYAARVRINGQNLRFGLFATEEEARAVVNDIRRRIALPGGIEAVLAEREAACRAWQKVRAHQIICAQNGYDDVDSDLLQEYLSEANRLTNLAVAKAEGSAAK